MIISYFKQYILMSYTYLSSHINIHIRSICSLDSASRRRRLLAPDVSGRLMMCEMQLGTHRCFAACRTTDTGRCSCIIGTEARLVQPHPDFGRIATLVGCDLEWRWLMGFSVVVLMMTCRSRLEGLPCTYRGHRVRGSFLRGEKGA